MMLHTVSKQSHFFPNLLARVARLSTGTISPPKEINTTYVPNSDNSPNHSLLANILLELTMLKNVKPESITFTPVLGGITNQLFRADFQEDQHDPLLIRIFGGEGMIDRNVENTIFAGLAEQGVAPSYHGRFANGRVEGWLNDAQPLELEQMSDPSLSIKIAFEMAKLHAYTIPPDIINDTNRVELTEPAMWSQLFSWLKQAQETNKEIESKWGKDVFNRFKNLHQTYLSHDNNDVSFNLDRVETELNELKQNIPYSPSVFSHNDLLAGNIMLETNTGNAKLIDFEYGGINYRGFDIANHWNEWAGGTQEYMNGICEYSRFPTKEQQHAFCRAYLEQEALLSVESNYINNTNDALNDVDLALQSLSAIPIVNDDAVSNLVHEANQFVLVNHWYWGLWAINQTTIEGIADFDYLTYAHSRAKRYFEQKHEQEQQ
jgi:ethanolamine kinase